MRIGSGIILNAIHNLKSTQQRISSSLSRLAGRADDSGSFLLVNLNSKVRELSTRILNRNLESASLNQQATRLSSQVEGVQSLRELAVQASSETLTSAERSRINSQISALKDEVLRQADGTFDLFDDRVGSGIFNAGAVSLPPSAAAFVRDLNGDGYNDILSLSVSGLNVSLGTGDGRFRLVSSEAIPSLARDADLADFNRDGILDLVFASGTVTNGTFVKLGRGDGSFGAVATISTTSTTRVVAQDVNEDGIADIVSGGYVYLGKGDGTFGAALNNAAYTDVTAIFDYNLDGHVDLIRSTTGGVTVTLTVNLGNGDGTFQTGFNDITQTGSSGGGGINDVIRADVNRDGNQDVIFSGAGYGFVYLGNGAGSYSFQSTLSMGQSMSVGDFNSDGNVDLLNQSNAQIYLNNGAGIFTLAGTVGAGVYFAGVGDLNGDGIDDVVASNLFINRAKKQSGLSRMQVHSAEDATRLLSILDRTLETLLSQQSKVSIQQNLIETQNEGDGRLASVLEAQREELRSPDISKVMSELVIDQIRQQAQIAVLTQANMQQRAVLQLLQAL